MTINAKDVLSKASTLILDDTNVRWPIAELRLWLNDALREIALIKPTAYSSSVVLALSQGTYQKLPDTYSFILRVTRNLKSAVDSPRLGSNTIRVVDRRILDAQNPNWHNSLVVKYAKIVKNICFDQDEPGAFYVYPGNDGTGFIEATVVRVPTPVPLPTLDATSIASYDFTVDVQDIYGNALVDYILYRAYSKDSQYSGSTSRASVYYGAFVNAIGAVTGNEKIRNLNNKPTVQEENAA